MEFKCTWSLSLINWRYLTQNKRWSNFLLLQKILHSCMIFETLLHYVCFDASTSLVLQMAHESSMKLSWKFSRKFSTTWTIKSHLAHMTFRSFVTLKMIYSVGRNFCLIILWIRFHLGTQRWGKHFNAKKLERITCFWHIWQYHRSFWSPFAFCRIDTAFGLKKACFPIHFQATEKSWQFEIIMFESFDWKNYFPGAHERDIFVDVDKWTK